MNAVAPGKPRALFVIPWCAVGGADQVNLDLIEALVQQGWEVTVATTVQGDYRWESRFAALTPDLFVMHRFLPSGDQPRFLRYLIESRRPDVVVVSNSEFGYELLPYLNAHCPDPAYVDLCHAEQEDWLSGGYPQLSNTYREFLDTRIAASAHLKDWMAERVGDVSDVAVCHIGVDVDQLRPDTVLREEVRAALDLGEDDALIVYIGRIAAEKQPMMLVETMERLMASDQNATMVIVGDGPDLASLRGEIRRRDLESRIRLEGAVEDKRLQEVLVAGDIFLLPSLREGIARTLCEAMAVGMVPVAADVGGHAELVTPDVGFLIRRSDLEGEATAYTNALALLIADPSVRRGMGARAREAVIAGFSLADMTGRFAELLDAAIERNPSGRVPAGDEARDASFRTAVATMRERNEMYYARVAAEDWSASTEGRVQILVQSRRLFGPAYRSLKAKAPGAAALLREVVHKLSGADR